MKAVLARLPVAMATANGFVPLEKVKCRGPKARVAAASGRRARVLATPGLEGP